MSRTAKVIVLAALVVVAFAYRSYGLDAAGLSEDEVNKVDAARGYLRGDFSQNLEHPMLMKLGIAACLVATDAWNERFGATAPISEEVPVRLPNVVFGSLTTIVLFLVGELFFGTSVGLLAALLWATGVSAIAINRIAKEDTLLVFFFWLCLYFYERAKRLGQRDTFAQHRLFGLAGASLGLMLASKYFPHYWALLFLFYHLLGQNETNKPLSRRDFIWFYGAFAGVFLACNPTVLLPSTLEYFVAYTREQTVTHHGYVLMGRLYANSFSATPGGLPLYFYPLLLGLKTPLPVLGAAVAGLAIAARRRRRAGYFLLTFLFVLWIVPFSVFAAKFYRYVLSLLPILYLAAAVGAVELTRYTIGKVRLPEAFRPVAAATVAVVLFVAPAVSTARSAPFYSLYLNALGRGEPGSYFPHDEFYDAGLREAILAVCDEAPPGAVVYGEAPPVFHYYQRRFGRADLRYVQLSDAAAVAAAPQPAFVIVQDGRIYFENVDYIRRLEADRLPAVTIRIADADAARVYHLARDAGDAAAKSPG